MWGGEAAGGSNAWLGERSVDNYPKLLCADAGRTVALWLELHHLRPVPGSSGEGVTVRTTARDRWGRRIRGL